MPADINATCSACQYTWETFNLTYRIGPLNTRDRNYDQLWCPQCLIVVNYITRIDRSAWTRWRRANESNIARSDFATSICNCISERLSKRIWFLPAKIVLSPLKCPRCPRFLDSGNWSKGTLICPKCDQRAGQIEPIDSISTMIFPDGIP